MYKTAVLSFGLMKSNSILRLFRFAFAKIIKSLQYCNIHSSIVNGKSTKRERHILWYGTELKFMYYLNQNIE